ncbi:hypothetical protein ACH5RR_038471 [Cinchona calisaya]|uniref:Thaumatin-like protein n=1 Tax=Cinchona calisaya TaxID=153742 RepID=A0ABD2XVZ1_9GENT
MKILKSLFISTLLVVTLLPNTTRASTFEIQNNCPYTVWAAAVPGGGQRLDTGLTWTLDVSTSSNPGRIWARTNCTFNVTGTSSCQTGDCGGVLRCTAYGTPPNTLVEYAFYKNNIDFLDISLVDGFNLPIELSRPSSGCTGVISCTADINGECPVKLRAPGGCNNPCTVFKTNKYCCDSLGGNCEPTNYSRFFKDRCPDAYSYANDDKSSTFTCPGQQLQVQATETHDWTPFISKAKFTSNW